MQVPFVLAAFAVFRKIEENTNQSLAVIKKAVDRGRSWSRNVEANGSKLVIPDPTRDKLEKFSKIRWKMCNAIEALKSGASTG